MPEQQDLASVNPKLVRQRPLSGFIRLLGDQGALLVFLFGLAAIAVGIWWLAPAWALIVTGGIVMLLALGAEMRGSQ